MVERKKITKDFTTFNSKRVERGKKGGGSPSPTTKKLKNPSLKTIRKIKTLNSNRIERGKTWGGSPSLKARELKS
jgi:hypothetical protein